MSVVDPHQPSEGISDTSVQRLFLSLILLGLFLSGCRTVEEVRPIGAISAMLRTDPDLEVIARRASDHRLQILVAEVVEAKGRIPAHLIRHDYRVDAEYFYPASSVKIYAALAALEWFEESRLFEPRLTLSTPFCIQPLFEGEVLATEDSTNLEGESITLEHEIRKLSLISDNVAFDRLYGVVGHRALNARAYRAGYSTVRINHRLGRRCTLEENLKSPVITFGPAESPILRIPERVSDLQLQPRQIPGLEVGQARVDGEIRTDGPMDFSRKNAVSLRDLQDALIALVRPDLIPQKPGYAITDPTREVLISAMRELPRQSENPQLDQKEYPDHWGKFLLPGLREVIPDDELEVTNKVGLAYGFTIENAYLYDRGTGRSLFITACLYNNPNQTLNDGVYGYEETAFPFWQALGTSIARRWLRPEEDQR